MDNDSFAIIIALLALFLTCLAFGLSVYYRRKAATLSRKLSVALEKLAVAHAELQDLDQRYQETVEFQKNLSEAELTTRLQQPRLSAQHVLGQVNAPERYLYVRSLAQNGMDAKEIASILSISTQEAEQLVNLSRLAQVPANNTNSLEL
ncbi:hypothetical protein [Desulfopila aestuarii]|uniref:DUF2802 domain-containing protein n=1 Tax=Desulfopila aestuarii DSM 18488 TaxID=1121416 RepID=A0A1M7YDN3_9BACT|nr:hypothetical protein [Desulfopila aestuarii]SHO50747.1 hypothetical protein SAMN02745220_03627 [Desulfopila aestuarii DSM 18488]